MVNVRSRNVSFPVGFTAIETELNIWTLSGQNPGKPEFNEQIATIYCTQALHGYYTLGC